jgi:hypothetical protein
MRAGLFFLTFGALACAVAPGQGGVKPMFDEVVLAKVGNAHLLYVVVLSDATGRDLDKLVVRFARPALVEAARYKFKGTTKPGEKPLREGNIVFAVRKKGADDRAPYFISPFSIEQLHEIVAVGPEKGLELAFQHNWTGGEVPRKK